VDSAKLNDWMQVIGIFAVVASLIFVGLQMKQAQTIAIGDQYQARASMAMDMYLARWQSEEALQLSAESISKGVESGRLGDAVRQSLEQEGPIMVAFRSARYRADITTFDNYHFQYEQGLLTESAWRSFRTRLKTVLANDINAEFYRGMRGHFRSSFHEVCDEILQEIAEDRAQ
jgi:hypothetical protein